MPTIAQFDLNRQLSSRDLSSATKLTLYKALILPVLLYGAQAWTLSNTDAAALGVFVRKVLRKIFDPVRVGDDYRIRTYMEQYMLFNNMDVAKCINNKGFRWIGHVLLMDEDGPLRPAVIDGRDDGVRVGRVEEALTSLGVTNWRRRVQSRGACG